MRKLIVLALLAAVVAASAIVLPASGATKTVRVGDNYFRPSSTTVSRNTTVNWRFVGDNPHNVTVTSGPSRFRSATRSSGSYRRKLTRRGTYRIICTVHGSEQRMTLRVR